MTALATNTFGKQERISGRKMTERLFGGNGRSLPSFPLRAVYMLMDRNEGNAPVQVLVSVSKRHFKRAVKRNRAKRQMREAYRNNKHILFDALSRRPDKALAVAFLWQADELRDSKEVEESMVALLQRIAEKL